MPPPRGHIHVYYNNTRPIKNKFYSKHLWEVGTNVNINNLGHMTKMAAMPIQDKNPSNPPVLLNLLQ